MALSNIKSVVYFLAFITFLSACTKDKINAHIGPYEVVEIGKLDKEVDESSGILPAFGDTLFWTHNDGNAPDLYLVNQKGKIRGKRIINLVMGDFEDIANDTSGNLYLCDVGNNANKRPWLFIHKYNIASNTVTGTIMYRYPDQHEFPPKFVDLNFDCEAVFYYKGMLYLFSKNRGTKNVRIYTVPSVPSKYTAKIETFGNINSEITAADINPSKTMFVILTYHYLYLFEVRNNRISFNYPIGAYKLGKPGQVEAVCFTNENDLIITNEQGSIYSLRMKP
jgi:hypothetical protein